MSDTQIKAIIIIAMFFMAAFIIAMTIVNYPTYNQRFVKGVPVVNCKYNQNIADLDDQYHNNRIVGVVINGYCAESDYDIVTGNRIKELNAEVRSLQRQITKLQEHTEIMQ